MEAMSSESVDGEGCCRRLCRRGLQWVSWDRSEERSGLAPRDSLGMERKGEAEEEDDNVGRMAGYLEKKGKSRLMSIWHRYWFVLEGQHLIYYDTQPRPSMEVAPPSKGAFMLIPPTSVTAKNSSRSYNSNHLSYQEIYILTPSQLVTLRTKDIDQHKLWMQALMTSIAPPLRKKTGNQTSHQKSSATASLFPLQPSTKHFHYSLTNLPTVGEKTTAWPSKSSHTMDNRNPNVSRVKCGSAGDIIDRYQERSPSVLDEDTSSEEGGAVETLDNSSLIRSDDDVESTQSPEYCLPIDHKDIPFKMTNEEEKRKHQLYSEEYMEENTMYGDFSDKSQLDTHLIKHSEAEKNSGKSKSAEVADTKRSQSQNSKLKSRKFFGMKESKRPNSPTKCQKIFKNSKEPEVAHKPNSPPQKMKTDQDINKMLVPKDDVASENCARNFEGCEVSTESISGNEPLQQILPAKPSTPKDPEPKSSKKSKKKKIKNTKESKGNDGDQPLVEIQSNQKPKLSKDGEQSEEAETKKNRKKKGFFSKMLKGKKNESQEDRPEETEEKQQINNEQNAIAVENPPPPSPELLNENIDKPSLEKEKPALISPKVHLGKKIFPIHDAELKRKLESRFQLIEAEQKSSSEMKISTKPEKKLPVPAPRIKNGATNKLSIPVIIQDDSCSEDKPESPKPLLPPRMSSRPPPSPHHDKPSHYLRVIPSSNRHDKSNSQDSHVTFRLVLPGYPNKYQTSEVNKSRNSSYDKVKVTGKKLVSISGISTENNQQKMTSELKVVCPEQEPVPQSELTHSKEEKSAVSEAGDRNVCRNLQEVNAGSVDFDAVPFYSPPQNNSRDSMVNSKHNTSAIRKHSPNNSNNCPILETVQVATLKETSDNDVQDVDVETVPVTTLKEMCDNTVQKVEVEKAHVPTLKETSDDAVLKVDELGLLLNELDRINSSPLEDLDTSANTRPMSEEIKGASFDENFLTAFPIRRRRNSDPDYDIPRPHRLPQHHQTSGQNRANCLSQGQYNEGTLGRQGVDSIKIEATCFFGPGMDCSYNENRYFCLDEKNNTRDEKHDDKIEVMNYMGSLSIGDHSVERCALDKDDDFFGEKANVYSDSYCDTYNEENIYEIHKTPFEKLKIIEKSDGKYFDMTKENVQEEEESVSLRASNIDRVCRTERSREIHECDIENIMALYESVEGLPISSTRNIVKNPETACRLTLTVTDHDVKGTEVSCDNEDKGSSRLPEDRTDSMKNETQMKENFSKPSSAAIDGRDRREDHEEIKTGETEIFLRQKHRSDDEESARKDHRTLRLSFATTETLIVEEEVLVATLKTTTTTTTVHSSANDANSTDGKGKQEVEEFVDEVVLDMDKIEDDQFGNMQVQSCVQT